MEENGTLNSKDLPAKGKKVARVGKNIAGTSMQIAGKTTKIASKTVRVAGKGMQYGGKGISAMGQGLSSAGTALSSTGVGALLGVPLMGLGAASKLLGKGTELLGKGTEVSSEISEQIGDKIEQVGKNVKGSSKILKFVVRLASFLVFKIIFAVIGFLLFAAIFIVILVSPLIELGIIDIGDFSSESGSSIPSLTTQYTEVTSSTDYWWPIGGSDITTNNSKEFATGTPSCIYISSYFGYRILDGESNYHSGMDISCYPSNTHNVIAVKDGTVDLVVNSYAEGRNQQAGYGNHVRIKHDDGSITIYAHLYLNSIKVSVGDTVTRGQLLAKMGNSGNSTGTHLHFEIRVNSVAVNPANYISSSNPRPS